MEIVILIIFLVGFIFLFKEQQKKIDRGDYSDLYSNVPSGPVGMSYLSFFYIIFFAIVIISMLSK